MENTGGMIAVVQGLRNSGLTVTLLDGRKQYTLMPEAAPHPKSPQLRNNPSDNTAPRHQQCATDDCMGSNWRKNRQENAVQATDGRYASTYKMMHCNVNPTSPPQNVTEFPPQRTEVIPGHSNFVVGGYGSGEGVRQATKTNSFRGAMCWPDRGSVCAAKPSVQPDAFANSLRKYPSISPERSTEIVERLISFTQTKNMSRNQNRCALPHNGTDSESSKDTYLVETNSRNSNTKPSYHPVVTLSKKHRNDSPIRERSRDVLVEDSNDYWNRPFCRDNEVRCFTDVSKNVKEGSRPVNEISHTTKRSSSYFKEQYDNNFDQRRILDNTSNNSVNIEIQAAAQMESKEILTLPRIVPMQRTIATAISPVSSNTETKILTENSALQCHNEFDEKHQRMPVPTNIAVKNDNIETNSRDIDSRENRFTKSQRSRSKEIVFKKNDFKDEIMKLLKDLKAHTKYDVDIKDGTEPRLKKIKHSVDRKPLLTVYENLRRSVSDNMFYYYNNINQFTISQPDTSNHTSDTLRDCLSVKTYDLCEKNLANKNNVLANDMKRPRCLSSSTNTNNSGFIDVSDNCKENNEIVVNNNTARSIFDNRKKYHKKRKSSSPSDNNNRYKNFFTSIERNKEPAVRNRKELRNSIDLGILAFTEKYRLHITTESLYKLREKLLDILLMNIKSTSNFNALNIKSQVKNVLKNNGFNECYAARFANILTEHWADEFSTNTYTDLRCSNIMSDIFIVLPNINIDSSGYQGSNGVPDYSINQISQKDVDANINLYMDQVLIEINHWLSNLRLPQVQDEDLRQTLLTNLATDIVDRQKYLQLNPSYEASDASELEYLKYQIFKWMYKLIGDNNMTPVERATELMERIRTIPVPVFYIQQNKLTTGGQSNQKLATGPLSHNINVIEPSNFGASSTKRLSTPAQVCCNRPTCGINVNKVSPDVRNVRDVSIEQQPTSNRRMSSHGNLYSNIGNRKGRDSPSFVQRKSEATDNTVHDSNNLFSGGIKIKDDENENTDNFIETKTNVAVSVNRILDKDTIKNDYIIYLNDWVQELPIVVSNEQDNFANAIRTEIFDKLCEVASKLRSTHKKGSNRFLYEDMLDEEIENLLSNIPQSLELQSKKHFLKVKLIEKTIDFLELGTPLGKSYKEQLIQQIKGELPGPIESESRHSELLQLYEELQILNLVEEFILCSHYENEDKVMSEAYRNKLVKHAKLFVEELKENHGKALMNIEANLYVNNILDTLQKVPLPSDETIKEEADEILLGLEIEKWFSQLPLIQNDDLVEQLHRRRLRNHLAKEIHNIENGSENPDNVSDNTIRHEVSLFLERAPLQNGESLNINSMVDDLIKRLKTRPTNLGNDTKKVGFHETDYRDFSENLPFSSSFAENPREPDDKNTDPKINLMNNKSIQAIPTRDSTFGGYYNIARPLLDDIKLESKCCETETSQKESPEYKTLYDDRPIILQDSDDEEPQWYTLQENTQEHPQTHISRNSDLHPYDRQHYLNNRQYPNYDSRYYNPEQLGDEFIVPQKYFKRESYQPHKSKIFSDRQMPSPVQSASRRLTNQMENPKLPSSYVPAKVSPRRPHTLKYGQDTMRSDIFNPQKLPFPNRTQGETERNDNISIPSPGAQDTVEESRSPHMKPSDLFYRSTDQEGIRRTIERNRSIEAKLNGSVPPEHLHGHYTPYMTMPPGYVPVRKGRKAFIAENFPEDSEEDIDEDEIHCKCVEKMWKSRRRPKHCPLENIDGYPPCISPPYYYPYFY